MKNRFALMAAAVAALSVIHPALATTVFQTENVVIPDSDLSGICSSIRFSDSITSISSVRVSVNIAGGYNGDYYAYLRNDTGGFAVLLNRVGATAANEFGSANSGFNIVFDDMASSGDIHLATAGGGAVSGLWQPDGRDASPFSVTDASARNAFLSSFNGSNPNTTWSLFVADVSDGGQGTLVSWGLTISGDDVAPVPEASTGVAGLLVLGLAVISFVHKAGRIAGKRN